MTGAPPDQDEKHILDNYRSINAGFRPVGIRRQAAISRGVPSDVILMDAVRDEFTDSVLAR